MLVLTRRCGESLVIGENGEIRVTFLATKGKQVRIGIEAPSHISVDREEIFLKKQGAKKASVSKQETTQSTEQVEEEALEEEL